MKKISVVKYGTRNGIHKTIHELLIFVLCAGCLITRVSVTFGGSFLSLKHPIVKNHQKIIMGSFLSLGTWCIMMTQMALNFN
jgi:hypothetical protein